MIDKIIEIRNQSIDELEKELKLNIINNYNFPAIKFGKNKKVEGILSLGDLRRLIKKEDISKKAKNFINKKPILFNDTDLNNDLINKIKLKLRKHNLVFIEDIILVDKDKKLRNILKFEQIENSFDFKKICVVGAGHIGLPLSIFLSSKSSGINLYEKDKKKLNLLKKSKFNFYEKNLDKFLIAENLKKKLLILIILAL